MVIGDSHRQGRSWTEKSNSKDIKIIDNRLIIFDRTLLSFRLARALFCVEKKEERMKIFLKDGKCYSSFPASFKVDMDVEICFARSATSYRLFGFRLRLEENFYHKKLFIIPKQPSNRKQ